MHISGQTHQLDRNMETSKFKCPHCSQAIDSIRSIQKHCKDHVANSGAKRVTSHYHPYANTTSDIHIFFKVLICLFCGSAWAPYAILGHCKKEQPNIKIPSDAPSKLDDIVTEYGIVSEVPLPELLCLFRTTIHPSIEIS